MLFTTASIALGLYSSQVLALATPNNGHFTHESFDIPFPAKRHIHPRIHSREGKNQQTDCAPYWLEDIKHQGVASFNSNPNNYTVFRNVKSYGAVGDGVTDDTAAIQRAMSEGNRCAPGFCQSSTTSPAIVYFPAGTYMISSAIIDYYYTQVNSRNRYKKN